MRKINRYTIMHLSKTFTSFRIGEKLQVFQFHMYLIVLLSFAATYPSLLKKTTYYYEQLF